MACDHAVSQGSVEVHVVLAGAVLDECVYLDEGVGVQQRVDALAGRLAARLAQLPEAGPVARALRILPQGVEFVAARGARHGSAKCKPVHQQDGQESSGQGVGRVLAEQILLPTLPDCAPSLVPREQVVQLDQR